MSESTQPQKPKPKGKTPQRTSSDPFAGSALFSAPVLPTLPVLPPSPSADASPQAPVEQHTPVLYTTPAPPAYTLRPFEQRHDRQTIYIDARKAGALDALVQLVARKNKTDLVDEMVTDILAKYAEVLRANEEMVQLLEEKYRKKHNL